MNNKNKKYKKVVIFSIAIILLIVTIKSASSVPSFLDQQGVLRNATSGALISGTYVFNASIYNISDDSLLYTEATSIVVNNGIWNHKIGLTTPIDTSIFNNDTYLIMKIGADVLSRVNLSSVPYAIKARDTELFGGQLPSYYLNNFVYSDYINQNVNTTSNVSFAGLNVTGNSYTQNIYPDTTLSYDIGSGALRWSNLYVTNISVDNIVAIGNIIADFMNITTTYVDELYVTTINASYIYNPSSPGGMDIRGDPWYLGNTDLQIEQNLLVDGNITSTNFFGNINASYVLNALWITNETMNKTATDLVCIDCIDATEILDVYVLNSGDTITGDLIISGNLTVIGAKINASVIDMFVNGSANPGFNNTFTVGESNLWWNGIYTTNVYSAHLSGELDCGNITGTTSDICTIVDTPDTFNTSQEMISAINNSQEYNIKIDYSDILNHPSDVDTFNTSQQMIDAVNSSSGYFSNMKNNWNNLQNVPAGFADGTDADTWNSSSEIIAAINASTGYFSNMKNAWANLQNIPAGFSDGTDDTFTYSSYFDQDLNTTDIHQMSGILIDKDSHNDLGEFEEYRNSTLKNYYNEEHESFFYSAITGLVINTNIFENSTGAWLHLNSSNMMLDNSQSFLYEQETIEGSGVYDSYLCELNSAGFSCTDTLTGTLGYFFPGSGISDVAYAQTDCTIASDGTGLFVCANNYDTDVTDDFTSDQPTNTTSGVTFQNVTIQSGLTIVGDCITLSTGGKIGDCP